MWFNVRSGPLIVDTTTSADTRINAGIGKYFHITASADMGSNVIGN